MVNLLDSSISCLFSINHSLSVSGSEFNSDTIPEHLLKLSSVIDELLSSSINKASFVGKALYCERYLSIS